jgi:2-polyprenyl-6-methoxyphenol hydroxylase-like FAD-dependent oxidoreductase
VKPSIAITGGGIAGLTTAIALQQIDIHPIIFEAAPVIREIGAGPGSAANAFQALHHPGLDSAILAAGKDLGSFIIYNKNGKVLSITNGGLGKYGPENFAIHRAALHNILLSHVNPQHIHTGTSITNITQNNSQAQLHFE